VVSAPRCARLVRNRFDPCDRFPFHLQIHFRVSIRRGRAGMAEIVADRRQIHPRIQKRYRRAVAHAVWMEPLLAEIRDFPASTVYTSSEDVANTEPSQGLATDLCLKNKNTEPANSMDTGTNATSALSNVAFIAWRTVLWPVYARLLRGHLRRIYRVAPIQSQMTPSRSPQ
jgi:hypothetical protein